MKIRVLGSAAGGGFPQWNCNCTNCAGLRNGTINAKPRTQSSITVSGDGRNWIWFNASPNIRAQLEAFPAMQPARSIRDSAIVGVVLIDGHIDHTAGLLFLREGDPIDICCTEPVQDDLTTGKPILRVLACFCGVNRHRLPLNSSEPYHGQRSRRPASDSDPAGRQAATILAPPRLPGPVSRLRRLEARQKGNVGCSLVSSLLRSRHRAWSTDQRTDNLR